MSKDRERCKRIIKAYLARGERLITSWDCFAEAVDKYDVLDEEDSKCVDNVSVARKLLRAVNYGVSICWLRPRWIGVGLTPWAGSARRQRVYEITKLAEDEIHGVYGL